MGRTLEKNKLSRLEPVQTQLLLIRPRPLDDELFSSWLVRLAWSNGEKLHSFCRWRLGINRQFWYGDPDRRAQLDAIEKSAAASCLTFERVFAATLASYEGVLYERHVNHGVSRWIMPIGTRARTHSLHGQQYCVECLREDSMPYFRRAWRLALMVACVKHGQILRDACPVCGAPIAFHEGDYARRFMSDACPIFLCSRCGCDLRLHGGISANRGLLKLQDALVNALHMQWFSFESWRPLFSISLFNGLHFLLRILASSGHLSVIRDSLLHDKSLLLLTLPYKNEATRFENLRIGDRYHLMQLIAELMEDWPRRFVRHLQTYRHFQLVFTGLQTSLPVLARI